MKVIYGIKTMDENNKVRLKNSKSFDLQIDSESVI